MNTNRLSEKMSFGSALNSLVCILALIAALYFKEYFFAVLFWVIWGLIIIIHNAVDVIGERLDKVQR